LLGGWVCLLIDFGRTNKNHMIFGRSWGYLPNHMIFGCVWRWKDYAPSRCIFIEKLWENHVSTVSTHPN
jgi:hypothetical protein